MTRSALITLVVAGLASACSVETLVVPEPPTVSLPATELLVIEGPGFDDVEPVALELPGVFRAPVRLSPTGRHVLSAFVYPASLAELRVATPLVRGAEYGALDDRGAAFVLEIDDGVASSWTAAPAPAEALAPYLVRRAPIALAKGLGELHTCLVVEDGLLYCTGEGRSGQNGDAGRTRTFTRVELRDYEPIAEVGTGLRHTCVRASDGRVLCFGENEFGQVGRAPAAGVGLRVDVEAARGAVALSVGANTTCSVDGDGQVTCWGAHLSDARTRGPRRVPFPGPVSRLETGGSGACVIVGGVVHCVGLTNDGEPPAGSCGYRDAPVTTATIALPEPAIDVAMSESSTCVITASGRAWCWGCNSVGQLGVAGPEVVEPFDLGIDGVVQIELGWRFGCALDASGDVWCFGVNDFGAIGRDVPLSPTERHLPRKLARFPSAPEELRAYWHHACARLTDGRVWCWGRGLDGQLGLEEARDAPTPVLIDL
ncbi:hypothetical protein L6R52_25170 [Myxococcota bacterium]|nr:hypothetical protein [Myxococcota bacterium]